MANDNGFDIRELEQLNQQFLDLAQEQYPKEAKKFLQKQGDKGKRILKSKYRESTKRRTGKLVRGVKRTSVKKVKNDLQVRVFNNEKHAKYIEHGHIMKDHNGKVIVDELGMEKWVDGYHSAALATAQLKREYPKDVDTFIDELLDKGLS